MDRIPWPLKKSEDAMFEFIRSIIECTSDLVCAYKLNIAFYEVLGSRGYRILERTLELIPDGTVVLCDAKRGDVGNTTRMYARSLYEHFGFDAVTVNPYQGRDSVQPFLDYADRGAFILCLTSNESAKEFQHLSVNGHPLYMEVARVAQTWNTAHNAGLVVGATYAENLKEIRKLAPRMPLLIPGIGAQGGDLKAVLKHGADEKGRGLLINSSRAILYASSAPDFAESARMAAMQLRDAINEMLQEA